MITKLYGDLIWNKYKDVEAPNLHVYQMCRKTPCFSYGDIRHIYRICADNEAGINILRKGLQMQSA